MRGKVYFITHAEDEGPGLLEGFFESLGWEETTLRLWRGDELPGDLDSAAGVAALGGPMNVYQEEEYPFLKNEDRFIKGVLREGIPFLSICLGAQLLAKACGATVAKSPHKEIGWFTVDMTPQGLRDLLFRGLGPVLSVFQWHEDAFALPEGSVLLATGRPCPNQAFRVGGHAYGLQFHLEVATETAMRWSESALPTFEADRIEKEGAPLRKLCERQARTFGANFAAMMAKGPKKGCPAGKSFLTRTGTEC